jgi:hypothetical protein
MSNDPITYGSVTKVTIRYTVGSRGFVGATTGLNA